MAEAVLAGLDGEYEEGSFLWIGVEPSLARELRGLLPAGARVETHAAAGSPRANGREPADTPHHDAILLDATVFPRRERERRVNEVLGEIYRADPRTQLVALVPGDDPDALLASVRAGVRDVLAPGSDPTEISAALQSAARMRRLLELREGPLPRTERLETLGQMIGSSAEMRQCFSLVRRVASSEVPVLITGESGTGKELAARAIHESGDRASGPFVPINCAAIPEPLLEAELFGHERGAFTGAGQSRPGHVEAADGGTLFLDEIGELAPSLQAKLLRFLEDHTVVRVGGRRGIPIDVRIVAATNRDLAQEVTEGAFRQDLYYRLAVFQLSMPALRERPGDTIPLARMFLERYGDGRPSQALRLTPDAEEALRNAPWPGNVRELINRVRRAIVVVDGPTIGAEELGLSEWVPELPARPQPLREARQQAEAECIQRALEHHEGNKSGAARSLGVSRTQLYELMHRHGLGTLWSARA
ncbi:MAG: sigma-54 dependent transcriptional regulator [Myxococcota bacterium]